MNSECLRMNLLRVAVFVTLIALVAPGLARAASQPNPVPFITSLGPTTLPPGTAPTTLLVNGVGFVPGSTVLWNGSSLNTTELNNYQLLASLPASLLASPTTATITVFSPGPGGGTSNWLYFTVENSVSQNYFSSRSYTGNVPLTAMVTGGDFNHDGKLDMVTALGPNVYVLLGDGAGNFASAMGSAGPANSVITGIHVADINNDGNLDLIINGKKGTTGFVATKLGNGDGTFQAPVETDYSGIASSSIVVGDFNKDGYLDVVLVSSGAVETLLGGPGGTFTAGPVTALSYSGRDGIGAADFNRDGNLDLVITAYDPLSAGYNFVATLPGNGDGSFGALHQVEGSGASYVGSITAAIGDFNGDTLPDIATAIQTAGATIQGLLYLSISNGDGTFTVGTSVPNVAAVTTPLLVGDFNADGKLDLATGGYFYFGQGDGTFPTSNGSAGAPTFVYAGDINGDGLLDVFDERITVQSSRSGTSTLAAIGAELQIPPTPDFKGIVAPLNTALVPGGSVSFTVTIEPLYGWTGDVTIGVTDLPQGMSVSYSPTTVPHGNGAATITLTAAPGLALGNCTITLSGNSGTLTHSTSVPVTVNSSIGDFGGSINPNILNIASGSSAVFPITITPIGGFTGTVALSVSGLPAGTTAAFSQNPITGGSGSSNLTITTTSSTPSPSVTNITLTATSGILVHSHALYLGVAPIAEAISGTVTPSNSFSSSAGGTAKYVLNLATSNNSANADMTLSVNGIPAGATGSFSPAVINTGTGSSTLSVTAPAGAVPQGSYELVITTTEDGSIAQTTVLLNVAP